MMVNGDDGAKDDGNAEDNFEDNRSWTVTKEDIKMYLNVCRIETSSTHRPLRTIKVVVTVTTATIMLF